MTHTISNMDDTLDSRDIIERIAELQGSEIEQWIAGWNVAGYMPDAEPCAFDNFEDARDYVADILQGFADDNEDEKPEDAALFRQCEDNIRNTTEEGEFSFTELRHAFWVKREADILEDADEAHELAALQALQEEAEDYCPDWTYGAQLIRGSYFEQAMDEMVADCYTLPKDMPFWMSIKLDYDALQQDYTGVDFDGVTYWVR